MVVMSSSSLNPDSTSDQEVARLAALHSYGAFGTPAEEALDRITALAARLFKVPISLVSLVGEEQQWIKSAFGMGLDSHNREDGFCTHVIASDEIFVVEDARLNPVFSANPYVDCEDGVRFYAGAPLINADGYRLGSLCVLDTKPRNFNAEERAILRDLAALAMDELELSLGKQRLQREIAEHSEAQVALEQSEGRFKNAFELSAIGMALVSPEGHWLQVNRKLCDLLGYSEAELLKRTFQELTYPDDLELDLTFLARLKQGEIDSCEIEKRYLHRDGTPVWTLLSVSAVRREDGQLLHLIAQIQHIGDRKRAEDDLRQSEARKSAIVDTALDCIITIDHQGHILEWNPAAEKTFGYTRDSVMGKELGNLIVPPELRHEHTSGISHYIATGEGPVLGQRLELPAVRADGQRITVELAVVPIPFVEPPIFTGHLRDIPSVNAMRSGCACSNRWPSMPTTPFSSPKPSPLTCQARASSTPTKPLPAPPVTAWKRSSVRPPAFFRVKAVPARRATRSAPH
jgi:PAS domain S-box-containing protein